jgi:uncharacterized protein (DUF983 family)
VRSALLALWRGIRRRCPRCGRGGLFTGFFTIRAECPGCGLRFEREEGFWVGAMIVNIGVAELVFAAVLVAGIVAWWPDVRWGLLTVIAVAVNAVVPIVFYPWSKTIWLALDGMLHRMDVRPGRAAVSRTEGTGPEAGPR